MRFYISLIIIAVLLTITAYYGVGDTEFLYLHDEFLTLSKYESLNSIFTRNYLDFGVANTTVYMLTFFDRVFYLFVYLSGISLKTAQIFLIFWKYAVITMLPYLGFSKLAKLYSLRIKRFFIFLVTLWYAFNTFTVIYWNGNGFSLTLITCYALAPVTLYLAHRAIFSKSLDMKHKILFVMTFYLMSFALPLFVVFLFLLALYVIFAYLSEHYQTSNIFSNLLVIGILYLPYTLFYFIILREMFTTVAGTVNLTGGETYNLLQGGFFTQIRMLFSWGIYTYWEPRNIFTFYKYYDTLGAKLAPFGIYLLLFWGSLRDGGSRTNKKYRVIFLALFALMLFMIKGAQEPFGDVYVYLIENYAAFRVFRSPDSKFGFGIILVLAAALLLSLENITKETKQRLATAAIILLVVILQGYPVFAGIAIKGQDTDYSSNRIIHIPETYEELAEFFNTKDTQPTKYILTVPSIEFGHYYLTSEEIHIGQDLLPKLIKEPFVYVSEYSGMLSTTYSKLKNAYTAENLRELSEFPIQYIVVRKDLDATELDEAVINELQNCLGKDFCPQRVFSNNTFTVYENKNHISIAQPDNVEITAINPSKFLVKIDNLLEQQELIFNQNYNVDWKLFPLKIKDEPKRFDLAELRYIETRPIFEESHTEKNSFGNKWTLEKAKIKETLDKEYYSEDEKGSINLSLIIYHKSQAIFYATIILAATYTIVLVALLGYLVKTPPNNVGKN